MVVPWIVMGGVTVLALLSLLGTLHTRREIRGGRPRFQSIVDYTGLWQRSAIDAICGRPDSTGRYRLSPEQIRHLPRTFDKRTWDSPLTDILSVVLALVGAIVILWTQPIGAACLALAGAMQAMAWFQTLSLGFTVSRRQEWGGLDDHA